MGRTFIWFGDNDNGEWIDSIFIDTCKNSSKREWRFCRNVRTGECYSQLLRAEDSDSKFTHSVILPAKLTAFLSNL